MKTQKNQRFSQEAHPLMTALPDAAVQGRPPTRLAHMRGMRDAYYFFFFFAIASFSSRSARSISTADIIHVRLPTPLDSDLRVSLTTASASSFLLRVRRCAQRCASRVADDPARNHPEEARTWKQLGSGFGPTAKKVEPSAWWKSAHFLEK